MFLKKVDFFKTTKTFNISRKKKDEYDCNEDELEHTHDEDN